MKGCRISRCRVLAAVALGTSLMLLPAVATAADWLRASNVTVEAITDSHNALYDGYRPGDSGVTNQWYRWITKYEKGSGDDADDDFKLFVPKDFAGGWNAKGNSSGIKLSNESGTQVTGDWNGNGSTNKVQVGRDLVEVYRTFDGFSFQIDSKLRSDNYFTIEYLARMGTNSTWGVTNGFYLDNGGINGGDWDNYVTDEVEIPTTYQPPTFMLSVHSEHGTPTPGTVTNLALSSVVTQTIASMVSGPLGTRYTNTTATLSGLATGLLSVTTSPSNSMIMHATISGITNDATLTWIWTTQHLATASAQGLGSVAPTSLWVNAGATQTFSATPETYYQFNGWTGSVVSATNQLSTIVTQSMALTGVFVPSLTPQGTPHHWLAQHGWTNEFEAAALADPDGDGLATWQEYLLQDQISPTNGGETIADLGLYTSDSIMDLSMGHLMLQVTSNQQLRLQLQLEQTADLTSGSWSNADPAVEWMQDAPTNKQFYRVRGAE